MKRIKKILGIIIIGLLIMVGLFLLYVHDDYDADKVALEALESDEVVRVTGEDPLYFSLKNKKTEKTGIIFYPGGKVEYESYAPLMRRLSEQGIAVFLVEVPFGLAVFETAAAENVMADYPEITNWYVAGHSLGGAMAAVYAGEHFETVDGLILLASYSTADLTGSDMAVLSIYGSEDEVLNLDKVAESRQLMPAAYEEIVIAGGNHAQFGNYGDQDGDGEAGISAKEQQKQTVEAIVHFLSQQ